MVKTSEQNDEEKLCLEDELDVLLPIYIFGQEKGWEFLEPEQLKKLIDGGRLRWTNAGFYEVVDLENMYKPNRENVALMVDMFMSILTYGFEKAMIDQLHYCSSEEWESKNQEEKWVVDKLVFYLTFGIKLDELPDRLFALWSSNAQVTNLESLSK